MTAAAITATTAQTFDIVSNVVSGTAERRLKCLFLEGPKAAQNDWFLLTTYLSTADAANIVSYHGATKITGDSYAIDVFTYDDDDAKLDCTSAAVGTTYVYVYYYTE